MPSARALDAWPRAVTSRPRLAMAATCAGLLLVLALPAAASATDVRGKVDLALPGVSIADVGPVVVYLERLDRAAEAPPELPEARIVQEGARFSPGFLVVSPGQPVDMPNADGIYHNVFSFSKPNDFDLGLYPAGQSRTVRFETPGLVKIYCSIHESMSAAILVAPGPHHAVVSTAGRFAIDDVPPGRYRLSVWCERLAGTSVEIEVTAERGAPVEVQWSPLTG